MIFPFYPFPADFSLLLYVFSSCLLEFIPIIYLSLILLIFPHLKRSFIIINKDVETTSITHCTSLMRSYLGLKKVNSIRIFTLHKHISDFLILVAGLFYRSLIFLSPLYIFRRHFTFFLNALFCSCRFIFSRNFSFLLPHYFVAVALVFCHRFILLLPLKWYRKYRAAKKKR